MKKILILLAITVLPILSLIIYRYFRTPICQLTTPHLIGLRINEVEKLTKSRGYALTIKDTIISTADKDEVIAQFPNPGTINCETIEVTINR